MPGRGVPRSAHRLEPLCFKTWNRFALPLACNSRCARSRRPAATCSCSCNGANHGSTRAPPPSLPPGLSLGTLPLREAIKAFAEGIQPAGYLDDAVKRHKRSIRRALDARFTVKDVRLVGSYDRGTAVHGASDADYFVIIRSRHIKYRGQYIGSNRVLAKVRRALQAKFKQTDMARDGQAIVVNFTEGPVDVLPAVWVGKLGDDDGYPVYIIPDGKDGDGGWMRTSPPAIKRYLSEADDRAKGKQKVVARTVKKWRNCQEPSVPLRSLYIERALAEAKVCEAVAKPYTEILRDAFRALADMKAEPLPDPDGVSDPIIAVARDDRKVHVVGVLAEAAELAQRAVEAEARGDEQEARALWNKIFNGALG